MKEYVYTDYKTNTVKSVKESELTSKHLELFTNNVLRIVNRYPKEIIPILIKELSK